MKHALERDNKGKRQQKRVKCKERYKEKEIWHLLQRLRAIVWVAVSYLVIEKYKARARKREKEEGEREREKEKEREVVERERWRRLRECHPESLAPFFCPGIRPT